MTIYNPSEKGWELYKNVFKNHKFGVEVEFEGIDRLAAAQALCRALEISEEEAGDYCARHIAVEDPQGREWAITYDASINSGDEDEDCELVTPTLTYKDLPILRKVLNEIEESGGFANYNCGVHVHVDALLLNFYQIKNLISYYLKWEEVLYQAYDVDDERLTDYCKPIWQAHEQFAHKLVRADNWDELLDYWYLHEEEWERDERYHWSRYHGLNLHAYQRHNTVEFRFFNGTLNFSKIKGFIYLCLAIVGAGVAYAHDRKELEVAHPVPFSRQALYQLFDDLLLRGDDFAKVRGLIGYSMEGARRYVRSTRAAG